MALLDRFFKPKWQHPDAQVRKQALQTLDEKDPVLVQLARTDDDPGLRRAALGRVNDLDLLRQIAEQDSEAGVREYAQARFRKLMAGGSDNSPALEQRLKLFEQIQSPELTEFLITNGTEAELRLAALEQTRSESLLGDLAINDPSLKVRSAALERIQNQDILQNVAKKSRNRDKRISKVARERLEQQQAEQQRNEAIEQICDEIEHLNWDGETGPGAARFAKLEEQWRNLDTFASDQARQRYQQGHERFLKLLKESAQERSARQALYQKLEQLLKQLNNHLEHPSDAEREDTTPDVIASTLAQIGQDWQALGEIAAHDLESQRLQRHFEQLSQTIKAQQQQLQQNHQQAQQRQTVMRAAGKLLEQSGQVLESDIRQLQQRWQRLPPLANAALLRPLQTEFDSLVERLYTRLQRQTQQKGQELEEIQGIVDNLEQALDDGELQQAIEFDQQARARLKENISLSRQQIAELRDRIQTCAGLINRLRSWRRWGTNRVRENLCEEMEALNNVPAELQNPVELARLIRAARNTWQNLDNREGAAPRALWKRFNDACEKAYEPCRVYFDEQSQERQSNLEKRTALCERLESFEADTDWEGEGEVDWRAVGRFERDIQKQWRKLGPVNRSDRKKIDQRYDSALQQLRKRLKPQVERDLQRRQALIRQVEGLLESDDLNQAIEQVKKLQTQWQPEMQASRRKEQALWKQFRAACDAIFERRQQQREAMDAERQNNLQQKEALCLQLEELAQQGPEILQMRNQVDEIREQWSGLGMVPKNAVQSIERRFNKALDQFDKNCTKQQQALARAEMDGLAEHARLCRSVEALLIDVDAGTGETDTAKALQTIEQQWSQLPKLKASLLEPVQKRFDSACQAVNDHDKRQQLLQTLQNNQAKKQRLCLQLEIARGAETPAEFAQERLEYQVARLSETMVTRSSASQNQALAESAALEREWYALGSLPIEQDLAMEERFFRALG